MISIRLPLLARRDESQFPLPISGRGADSTFTLQTRLVVQWQECGDADFGDPQPTPMASHGAGRSASKPRSVASRRRR